MTLRLIALLSLTIAAAVIHGRLTERWRPSEQQQQSADRIRSIPKQLGNWKHVKDGSPLSPAVKTELGITDYVSRVYSSGDASVSLLLLSGKTGRLVRHRPDICYGAVGNTFLADPTPVGLDVDGTHHDFLTLPIHPQSQFANDFVVVYGFTVDGQFSSPTSPRLKYHGIPVIEKVQVLSDIDVDSPTSIPEPAKDFITELCRYYASTASN